MSKKKRAIFISLIGVCAVVIVFLGYFNTQVNTLVSLGYPEKVAKEKTKVDNVFNVVKEEKEDLEKNITTTEKDLTDLGIKQDEVSTLKTKAKTPVEELNVLKTEKDTKTEQYTKSLTILEAKAKKQKIKYQYPDDNVYNRNIYLSNVLSKNYAKLIVQYRKQLAKQGYSKAEIKKMNGKTSTETLRNLQKVYNKEAKKLKNQLDQFSSKELRDSAMRMFRETNEYRASKGLKPYKYNYKMQSCVFKEAKAYASNKNPHNWVCQPIANENAGLASANSDYVKAAMDFFKTDPPHEQVLLGNHKSVAIAIVNKDGMNYMIMDVFN